MTRIDLPWPPSINHYWRRVGPRTLISRDGRAYRIAVGQAWQVAQQKAVSGRLKVEIWAFPPDRRVRDLDNLLKATLDALQHAGAYEDDAQIDDLHILRGDPAKPGRLAVYLHPLIPPVGNRWALDNVS